MYFVKVNPEYLAIEDLLLLPKEHNRVYGFKLKKMTCETKYEILNFMRPSSVVSCDFKSAVDKVYATDLGDKNLNKFIVNKITGLAEKWNNKKTVTKIFMDFSECQYYQIKHGGMIHKISHSSGNVSGLFVN
jgi:hypothetical protein